MSEADGLLWRGRSVGDLDRDELVAALVQSVRALGESRVDWDRERKVRDDFRRARVGSGLSDDALSALIKPLWLVARPGLEAQSIRGVLSNAFDDARLPGWASDYIPDYVWDLVDIAAQRGLELGRKGGG